LNILITGGAGFIGSNLANQLLVLGGDVLVIDDLSTGPATNLNPKAGFRKLDIRDEAFVEAALEYQPDTIVHLAAISDEQACIDDPDLCHSINVGGTDTVIRAALACGVERLIFASTSAVYGDVASTAAGAGAAVQEPLVETSPLVADTPFAASKLAAEQLIAEKLGPSDVDYAIMRLSEVYGPREHSGIVAHICEVLAGDVANAADITEAGSKLSLHGDADDLLDLINVSDVGMALVSFIGGEIHFADPTRSVTPQTAGIYNISSNFPVKRSYIVNTLLRTSTNFLPIEYLPRRSFDATYSVLDHDKATEVFEWTPQLELEGGLEKAWSWHQLSDKRVGEGQDSTGSGTGSEQSLDDLLAGL